MTFTVTPLPRLPAYCPAAQPCALGAPEQTSKTPLWNDTPDAIAIAGPLARKPQQPRAFSATTASQEADHSATTRLATH